jgi:type IV secretion system protein VirB9
MRKKAVLLFICAALAGCATVDMEKKAGQAETGKVENGGAEIVAVPLDMGVVQVERPVYRPPEPPAAAAAPARGRAAVTASNSEGILPPADYSRAAMIYDYHADYVYELYTQPLRASDIMLEAGERAVEQPFISDSERWMLGAGVSYENSVAVQHIYVKPTETGLEASLIINTDRRVYHIILKSYRDVHMPMVKWRYPFRSMPSTYVPFAGSGRTPPLNQAAGTETVAGIDPRFISFNYRITYGLFSRPSWLPSLVYDDGGKTYINFPESVLQRELPGIFENRNDTVNYRVVGNIVIIDRLVEKVTVRIGRSEITITKKRR